MILEKVILSIQLYSIVFQIFLEPIDVTLQDRQL